MKIGTQYRSNLAGNQIHHAAHPASIRDRKRYDQGDAAQREAMKKRPEDPAGGDFVRIPDTGACAACHASRFNGFPLPATVTLREKVACG